jgi:hypothetical protein
MNIALTVRRTLVQLERFNFVSPATMIMSSGLALKRGRNQTNMKCCISSAYSKKVRSILKPEIQYMRRIKKKIPAFPTETKIFVFRNFTDMTDDYCHD